MHQTIRPLEHFVMKPHMQLVFLAGSMDHWRDQAIDILTKNTAWKNIVFVHPDWVRKTRSSLGNISFFDKQKKWESYYLNKAKERGVILYWQGNPRSWDNEDDVIDEGSHALGPEEIGEAMAEYPEKMVVGMDPKNEKYTWTVDALYGHCYLDLSHDGNILDNCTVSSTLEDTCARALVLLNIT